MSFDLRIPKPPRGAAARAADDQDDEADPPLVSTFPLVTARAIITALTIMVMHATVVSLMKICETIVPLGGGRSRHCTRWDQLWWRHDAVVLILNGNRSNACMEQFGGSATNQHPDEHVLPYPPLTSPSSLF